MKNCIYILLFIILMSGTQAFSQSRVDEINKLIRDHKYDRAISLLENSRLDPQDYNRLKGFTYYGLYNPDSTIFYLEKSYHNNIQDDDVLIKFAQALLWKKNYKDASPLLEKVKNKSNPEYLKVLANKYEILGDYTKAIRYYDIVIKNEKLPYGTMERKAILLSWMKQFDDAIILLNKIIKTKKVSKPLRLRCKIKKAEILSWKKEFDEAIKILDELLKTDKKNIPARLVKAQILEWTGKYKDAKDIYKEVLLIDPNNYKAKRELEKLLWVK